MCSIADLIRRTIERQFRGHKQASLDGRRRRAWAVVGKYASEPNDLGLTHDDYPADSYAETADSPPR